MKHTFSKLARGVKLQTGHIYTAVSSALQNLTSSFSGVEVDQMACPSGPFTIHLSVPSFDANRLGTSIPFVLPAYQDDQIWATGEQGETTPVFKVEEFGLSFDSYDELRGIGAHDNAKPNELIKGALSDYKLEVSILETLQESQGYTVGTSADQQFRYSSVWSSTIPATAWEAGLNPKTYSDISAELKPFRTYIVRILAPDFSSSDPYAMPNLNVWLKLNTELAKRDVHAPSAVPATYVQNIPTVSDGAIQATPITTTSPVAGDKITAEYATPTDAYDGVQTALGKVDKVFRDKLRGNYNTHSELPADESLADNAGYKVIAVPMWGNRTADINSGNVTQLPYIGVAPHTGMAVDRRIIPISQNFTVHHVIACANYSDNNYRPGSGSSHFTHSVGVGIGCGLRSDSHTYQQVAHQSWNPAGGVTPQWKIDTCSVQLAASLTDSWQIVSVPLVSISGETTDNYGIQGKPFFIGQSRYRKSGGGTDIRTNVGVVGGTPAPGATPKTAGTENFIEVRWGIQDTNGLGNLPATSVIVPHYGNWVYIIGKTTTVTSNQE